MPKRILLQLDTDPQPSTFDAVVAVDAGADVLLRHGGVTPRTVVPLVHGAMFTRGGPDLAGTAVFVGGSDVAAAEEVCAAVRGAFFGPVRVSVLLDPSGANTTAAAAERALAPGGGSSAMPPPPPLLPSASASATQALRGRRPSARAPQPSARTT